MTEEEKKQETAEEAVEQETPKAEDTQQNPDQEEAKEPDTEEPKQQEPSEEEAPAADTAQPADSAELKYARLYAEFQNYKRRTEKEKSDVYAFENEKFACTLLDVIDNFERAMAAKPEGNQFADGMELILKQLMSVLEKNKVTPIDALGKPFDPNFHNAVMTREEEGTESGTVVEVLQKGFVLNNKVIRPAMVVVSQ